MGPPNRQQLISQLWNGDPINRIRAGDGISSYFGRRLSMHLMAQPAVLANLLEDGLAVEQGFLARALICQPTSTIGTRLYRLAGPESHAALGLFNAQLRRTLAQPLPTDGDRQQLEPRTLTLSHRAEVSLRAFHDELEFDQAPGGKFELVRSFASKAPEQAVRIAAVLTLWSDIKAQRVGDQAMEWGIELARYYMGEAARVVAPARVSIGIKNAEKLSQWLNVEWQHTTITPREIQQSGPNALRNSATIQKTIQILEEYGHLSLLPEGTMVRGVRRKTAYQIVK
ncbi:DUF3987 domain-containing protein [Devosia sp. MC532]|uniref:DUF3987 domain-containing protein n=1 Tax=Devosia sp. MC532 TaxID=2799788 RepID=UPI0018F598BE|nr:DUF3987 domain-containing protein [Devosia sp. MC532]